MAEELKKKCRRGGCNKQFVDSENTSTSCHFHTGKPMFHDTKKGWTCCSKVAFDWDDFAKLETCAVGQHSDIDPMKNAEGQGGFFQSSTVANADAAVKKEESKPVVLKKISDYETPVVKPVVDTADKKVFLTPTGNLKCTNKGCLKEFKEADNSDEACKHHSGAPIFHDLKKYWSCCQTVTHDWDDFMKLPTCTVGKHQPKYV